MKVFLGGGGSPEAVIEQIVGFAMKARKNGLIALENDLAGVKDAFLQKALRLMVDGVDPKMLRETMETEIGHLEEEGLLKAKFFEAAGGYAPTVGIIGAVLGLIHVMENLADPSKLGSGIAVAFVATVYGVGSANLILLPHGGEAQAQAPARDDPQDNGSRGDPGHPGRGEPALYRGKAQGLSRPRSPEEDGGEEEMKEAFSIQRLAFSLQRKTNPAFRFC